MIYNVLQASANDSFAHGIENELRGTMQIKFLKDMATMRFNSVEADVKCCCNLFIRPSFGQQLKDFTLSACQQS